jgi:MFS family permease
MTSRAMRLDPAPIRARLIGMLTAIVTVAVVALGFFAITAFDRAVKPELANRTRLIGSIIRSEVQRNLELGIPINALVGLDRYLTEMLEHFGEVDRISVKTATGATLAEAQSPTGPSLLERLGLGEVVGTQRNTFSLPILAGNELVGAIVVEVSPQFVETRLRDVFLDVVVIALVAILIAVELVLAVAVGSVGKPFERLLRLLNEQSEGNFIHRIRSGGLSGLGRAATRLNDQAADLAERLAALPAAARARLAGSLEARIAQGRPVRLRVSDFNDIRLALFLFSLATEIAAAFLPLYARAAARPNWLSPEVAAAAPLALYLIAIALISPLGGTLARRFGPRRIFLAAVPPTALALIAMGLSDSIIGISLARAVTAVFYALATIACHEYAIRAAARTGSARPAGAFVAVVFGGVFAGSALGGVLASRFGFEAAFFVAAVIAALSAVLGKSAMMGRAGDPWTDCPAARAQSEFQPRVGTRFVALLAGIVAPMNAATTVFIWYLSPLMLSAFGYGPAEIARVVMLYYLAIVLLSPSMAQLADGRAGPVLLVIGGSAVAGLALLSLGLWDGFWAVTVAVAGLGVGHSLVRAPHYALALKLAEGTNGLGALRLVERGSALLGLFLSALLVADLGAGAILRVLGMVVLTGAAAFAMISLSVRTAPS